MKTFKLIVSVILSTHYKENASTNHISYSVATMHVSAKNNVDRYYVNVCIISLSGLLTATAHIRVYSWIIYNVECCVILLTGDLQHVLCMDSNCSNIIKSCSFIQNKNFLKFIVLKNDQKHVSFLLKIYQYYNLRTLLCVYTNYEFITGSN